MLRYYNIRITRLDESNYLLYLFKPADYIHCQRQALTEISGSCRMIHCMEDLIEKEKRDPLSATDGFRRGKDCRVGSSKGF